jgi:hypothetical protein
MSGNNSTNHSHQNIHIQQNFDRVLLNVYIDMYNTTLREIDRLYDNLDDIRNSIRSLEVSHRNMNLNTNTNTNRNYNNNNNRNTRRMYNNDRVPLESNPNRIYLNGRYYTIEYVRPDARVETNRRQNNQRNANNILGNIFLNDIVRNFYDPVIVRPTAQEIQNATMNTTFGSIVNPINNSCPISLERFEHATDVSQIIHCGHIFNPSDLNVWFQTNVKCPVCRYDIRRYNRRGTPPQSNNLEQEEEKEHDVNVNENENENANENAENPLLNNSNISNIQYNENGDITFDISGNPLINFATQALTDLLRNNNTRNRTINNLLDPSNNSILLFETILRRNL